MKRSFWKKFLSNTTKAIADSVVIEVKGRVNAGKLNVRKKPSLKAAVVAQLTRGDIVDVFNVIEDWYQIVLPEKKTAYVYKKYIEIVRQEKSGRITANVLNIRSMPNTSGDILGKLHKGDIVSVLREYNEWIKIQYGSKEAYLYKEFVELADVPVVVNPTDNPNIVSGEFFYQRKDLVSVTLEPKKTIPVQGTYHEKIAAKTWNNYGGFISKVSDELQIDVATGLAVLCVESGGNGFSGDKMIIRFENHVLDMFWGKNNVDLFDDHFKYDKNLRRDGHYFRADKKDDWEACHTSQDMEWKVLNFAKTLDDTAALKSISMGAPQVMGFNHKFIGYATPQEMFSNFNKDIRYHLMALFDFCNYKPERIRYLQKRDFYSFSYEYNGPADPKGYEKRLKMYYDIFKEILK
ncbi:MAG: DUF3380 domain-containing protein [Bacteroidales bacterium]|nr:DUF3380 domain-containing protein [Bacteroidales bacterium]